MAKGPKPSGPSEGAEHPDAGSRTARLQPAEANAIVREHLEPVGLVMAFAYAVFTFADSFLVPAPFAPWMVSLAGVSTLAFLLQFFLARGDRIPARYAHPVIAVGFGLVLVNTLMFTVATADPVNSVWFLLILPAIGLVVLSTRWFLAISAVSLGVWALAVQQVPPTGRWFELVPFFALGAMSLSSLVFLSRRRYLGRLRERERVLQAQNIELDRLRRKAEAAEGMKSQFLATISHDLRTPLNAILGEAQLLLEGDPDDPQHRVQLETIHRSGRHLLSLIDQLLDLSRMETGMLELHTEPVEVEGVVSDSLEMVSNEARAAGLELRSSIDGDAPERLETDPGRLRQVLVNLLGNAVKFTAEGAVELRVRPEPAEDGPWVRFELEDTGPGIPEEDQARLFHPFSRLEVREGQSVAGTGLGLAICRHLVELMGGELGVASTVGTGSTFWFRLPPAPPEASPREAIELRQDPSHAQSQRVLVVDDDPVGRGILVRMLEHLGHQAEGVGDAETALERGPKGYDVVFLDVELPGMDGLELARRLRDRAGTSVTLVAVTGHRATDLRQTSGARALDGVLTKPVELDDLILWVGHGEATDDL